MRRTEDRRFVTGRGCFVADFTRPRAAHAVVVRSAVAHARVTRVDSAPALAMPGVLAVLTAADVPARTGPIPIRLAPLPGFERYLQWPVARDRVRYVGEPVAMVVAEDRAVAEDAAARVAIEYDMLDAVVRVERAAEDRVLVHEAAGSNVATSYTAARGDVDAAFARAEYTRRETFRCHRHTAVPLETRGLVAEWDAGRLTVWGATKVTFFNRRALAAMLGLEPARLELVELDVGGSFGVRGEFYPEDFLVPFAAMTLGRPVKWIEDRRESLLATNHSREIDCELEIAARADGTILGLRGRLDADMGAYVRTNGGVVPAKAAQFLSGPYRIPDFRCDVRAVITNKTPVGTYRGPGRFEANFFRERLLDLMAADLGIDPAELRLRNLLTRDELPRSLGKLVPYEAPSEYDAGDYASALRRALEAIDYGRLAKDNGRVVDGRRHGVGIGCFVESSGAGPSETARIVIEGPGRVNLYTGCSTSGQGHETVMAQILADDLEIPADWITVFHGSTSFVEEGYGTYHSRAIVVGGSAIKVAASTLSAQLVALAAARTGLAADTLVCRGGNVYRRDRADAPVLSLASLAAERSPEAHAALTAAGRFAPGKLTYTYGTHIAHVAVDAETGAVDVLKLVTVEDVGRAVNPLLVHGQALGAAVQGLSGAFLEELVYDEDGQLLTGTLADYALPTAADFPCIEAITLEESPSALNPLGAKGAGEGGIVATGAAAANAVAAALAPLGVVVRTLPLSATNVARWIAAARHGD
ncbi:MAG: xanthine dehydrogenase family protein molybdopterin-binding subunit [Candidatus Rokubacteria bacterium]|nr:xanthine dehydrogenase family protein molybdopterin-binding subunit [Candidatus Rokubacteria bacterium]